MTTSGLRTRLRAAFFCLRGRPVIHGVNAVALDLSRSQQFVHVISCDDFDITARVGTSVFHPTGEWVVPGGDRRLHITDDESVSEIDREIL